MGDKLKGRTRGLLKLEQSKGYVVRIICLVI